MPDDNSNKKIITFDEIALALANDYDSLFAIDMEDDSYVEYLVEGDNKLSPRLSGDDFYKDVSQDISVHTYPEDREGVRNSINKDRITEVYNSGTSFTLNYRLVIDGEPRHYLLKMIRGSEKKVIIGVRNVDEQRRRELEADHERLVFGQIADALASRYEVIYYINSITNEYTQYSSSDKYATLGTTSVGNDFFKDAFVDIRKYIHKDDVDYLLSELDKPTLMRHLEESGTVTLTYRQQLGGDIVYVTMVVVRPKNDKDHIVMGVINIDAQMKREQKLLEESEAFNDLAMALATRYEVIYRVNLETCEYYEYSASEKYSKLEVGSKGDDFFADSQMNMKKDIYYEDYPMMSQMITKDAILKRLEGINKFFLNYRLNLDGRPQYVSLVILRLKDDSDHLIVALENIDEAKKRELEFEAAIGSALDMANKDALTGVKNKHAYVNAEVQLDNEITEEGPLEFAVAIFDINGLKEVNDEHGHSSGDTYIKDACDIICRIFDHSPVYRIGGDEFVAILRGNDYKNRFELVRQFSLRQIEQRSKGLVTLAYGLSEYMPDTDNRVQDVFERADALMYENKKRFKSETFDNEPVVESYSFVRFYELYEKLLSAMVNFEKVDAELIGQLLVKISHMFRLSKGVVRVYRNRQEEMEGGGETICPFDYGGECVEIKSIRAETSVLSSATITIYQSPDAEPLTYEEYEKVELVMRTVLSFVTRNRLKDIIYDLAFFDDAGYPNLRSLNNYLMSMIMSGKYKGKFACRYNLRHFSLVNQEWGRPVGDVIMKKHFEGLKEILGERGFMVRLGGDNFVCIGPASKVDEVKNYLFEAVIKVDDVSSVKVQTSAGIYCVPEDGVIKDMGDIMNKIINAFRAAQSGGSDHIIFYDERILQRKQKSMRVQQLFSDALAKEEFVPYYQPKVDINTGKIIGGEALCRWFHDGQMISPVDFIPALEKTSDICKLDLYMLEHVCRDQRKWLDGGENRKLVPMSINFSRKHIMNVDLPDVIVGIMDKYRIPHESVEVELTETTTDVEFSDLRRVVTGLHEKGIKTSVDDFGMGFSSLNLLKGIPWSTIKIDKAFLPQEDAPDNDERFIMFKGVVTMAKSLGFNCIAEGVETEFQLQVMRDAGCDIAQGFYYDKPLPKLEFEERLVTKSYAHRI